MSSNADEQERRKLALEVIRQLVTQVLTLNTSLVAAAVALAKLSSPIATRSLVFDLLLIFHVISVIFGLLAMGTIVSCLVNDTIEIAKSSLIQVFVSLELICFFFGLALAGFYAASLNVT